MKIVRLSRKEFRERFGDAGAMTVRNEGEEPTVYLPGRASTKEILHEIYHATKSPRLEEIEAGKKWFSADERALEELRAQEYAVRTISKEDLPTSMIGGIAMVMLYKGYRPATIMGSISRALEKEGYEPLSREERSWLWELIREEYSKAKEEW